MYDKEDQDNAARSIAKYIKALSCNKYLMHLANEQFLKTPHDYFETGYTMHKASFFFSISYEKYKKDFSDQFKEEEYLCLIAYLILKKLYYTKLSYSPEGNPYVDCYNDSVCITIYIHLRRDLKEENTCQITTKTTHTNS